MKINYVQRFQKRITKKDDPAIYQHLIKPNCVVCDLSINSEDYEQNGNFCPKCCSAATRMGHRRLWEKREMDELMGRVPVDNHLAILRSMV